MHTDFDPPFIMTSLTGRTPVDIIRPANRADRNVIVGYLDANNIGYEFIDSEDAAKLIAEYDNIGTGCFIGMDDTDSFAHQYRQIEATLRYIDLSAIVGMISIEQPVALEKPAKARRTLSIRA